LRRARSSSRDDGAHHRDTGEGRSHRDRYGRRQAGRQGMQRLAVLTTIPTSSRAGGVEEDVAVVFRLCRLVLPAAGQQQGGCSMKFRHSVVLC